MPNRLQVSIASDIIADCMSVELHSRDRVIVKGVITDRKLVLFPDFSTDESFTFDEVCEVFKEFISKMEAVENGVAC